MRISYKLRHDMYRPLSRFCYALTNFHISLFPLRREDGKFEKNYEAIIRARQQDSKRRRAEQVNNSNKRRRQRTAVSCATASLGGNIEALDNDFSETDSLDVGVNHD